MERLNEILDELYLNYDTMHELSEENISKDEIEEMFKDEIEYPEELTSALLKFKKSYLRSVVMRIKFKLKKNEPKAIKSDLLNYNESLKPLLDKLLSSPRFEKSYNETMKGVKIDESSEEPVEVAEPVKEVTIETKKEVKKEEPKEVVEEPNEIIEENVKDQVSNIIKSAKASNSNKDEDEDEDDSFHLEEFMEEYIDKTGEKTDLLTVNQAYEYYKEFYEEHGDEYEEATKKELKKFLSDQCGKYSKNGFIGYKIMEIDDEESE